jgi:hypothetical protein
MRRRMAVTIAVALFAVGAAPAVAAPMKSVPKLLRSIELR